MAQIDELNDRRKQLDARIAQLQAKDKDDKRRRETRAKIVLGGAVIVMAQHDVGFRNRLIAAIPRLIQNRDQPIVMEALNDAKTPPGDGSGQA